MRNSRIAPIAALLPGRAAGRTGTPASPQQAASGQHRAVQHAFCVCVPGRNQLDWLAAGRTRTQRCSAGQARPTPPNPPMLAGTGRNPGKQRDRQGKPGRQNVQPGPRSAVADARDTGWRLTEQFGGTGRLTSGGGQGIPPKRSSD